MFKRAPEANINGTSLKVYLDGLNAKSVRTFFGEPDKDAFYEPERGYDGDEYKLIDEDGNVVHLYARFGAWRIGAHRETVAREFEAWLSFALMTVAK